MAIDLGYIQHLAENHEGVDVEFKETTGQLNRGMETLCGMINGGGGVVIFGVSNKGKIIGQEIGDKTTREIGEAINKFDPAVDIQPIYVPIDNSDKYVIVFRTDGLETDKPYMWDGKPYRRHDSVTSVMPREKFIRLHELQHGLKYKWENEVNHNLTIDDLDERLIHNVIRNAGYALRDSKGPASNISSTTNNMKVISLSWWMRLWLSSSSISTFRVRRIIAFTERIILRFPMMLCVRLLSMHTVICNGDMRSPLWVLRFTMIV